MIILRPSLLYIIQFGKSLSALLYIHKALLSVPGTSLAWQLSHLNVFNLSRMETIQMICKNLIYYLLLLVSSLSAVSLPSSKECVFVLENKRNET